MLKNRFFSILVSRVFFSNRFLSCHRQKIPFLLCACNVLVTLLQWETWSNRFFFASTQVVGCGCRVCLRVRSKDQKKIAITIQSQIDESRFQIFVGNQISWKPLNILPLHKHQQRFSENFPAQQICTWSVFADRDDIDEGGDYYFQLCPLNIVKDSFRIKQLTEHCVYTFLFKLPWWGRH